MDVKRVPAPINPTISASAETGDREQAKRDPAARNRKARPAEKKSSAPTPTPEAEISPGEAAHESQLLDSEKVVHLLEKRSTENVKKATILRRIAQATESKKPSVIVEKKLNKSA